MMASSEYSTIDEIKAVLAKNRASRYIRHLHTVGVRKDETVFPVSLTSLRSAAPGGAIVGTSMISRDTTELPRPRPRRATRRTFAQGSLTDYPLTLLHRDGTLTDVLYNASVYRDFNDNPPGVLAVARDAAQLRHRQQLSEQLQGAPASRIVIEEAKGITAQRHRVTIDQAYQLIRTHARNNNASLRTVAKAIVEVGLQV